MIKKKSFILVLRLGWQWTNTLAYDEKSQLTVVKSFITLAPELYIDDLSMHDFSRDLLLASEPQ
jgi:hypothetical protein